MSCFSCCGDVNMIECFSYQSMCRLLLHTDSDLLVSFFSNADLWSNFSSSSLFFCIHIVPSSICSANMKSFTSNPSKPHCGKTENAADLSAWSMLTRWRRYFFFLNNQVDYTVKEERDKREVKKRRSGTETESVRAFLQFFGKAFTYFSVSAEVQEMSPPSPFEAALTSICSISPW